MLWLFLLLLVLLALTAFFSGAETALFSLSRHERLQLSRDPRPSARLVGELLRHPRKVLLTLMIGNVTVNMFIFAVSLSLLSTLTRERAFLAAVLGLASPIILGVVGDSVPKGVAIALRRRWAGGIARLIQFFQVVLMPFSLLLNGLIVEPITRLLVGGRQPDDYVTVDELRELLEMSERHRIIDADENAMLSEVVRLGELKVRDVMVPRVDIIAFDAEGDYDDLREFMSKHKLSKVLVYRQTIEEIAGLVYSKDLLLEPYCPVSDVVRPVTFVPEMIRLTQLLSHFRQTRTQLAVAVDEYGGIVGMVTVEDIAEQIVGELADSTSAESVPLWEKTDAQHYRVHGSISIRDWSEQFHMGTRDERVSTLAGLMLSRLGRIPAVGDEVRMGNLRLTVESLRGRRIDWIALELLETAGKGGSGRSGRSQEGPA